MDGDGLGLAGRRVLVTGVANRRSVAFHTGRALAAAGAEVVYAVRSEARREELARRLEPAPVHVCDVERQEEIDALCAAVGAGGPVHGLVHSIAFADFEGFETFHGVEREKFLQAVDVSCFSLIALARGLEPHFAPDAAVVTISISDTHMAAANYGFMSPAKAALDSSVVFLAKSLSPRGVRVNAVKAGPLKTSASAGIPGYVESYLFAEACTFRGKAVRTEEVADTALFLLSPRSSGINGQGLVVDAGMGHNYFDRAVVERATGAGD